KIQRRKMIQAAIPLLLSVFALGIGYSLLVPDISRLRTEAPKITAFMKYRRAKSVQEGKSYSVDYKWIPLDSMSSYLLHAVVIAEDDKFWSHSGFDIEAIKLALEKNMQRKSWRHGGSTITQQLAKNLYLSPSRNPLRKFREFALTWRLERALSKKRILELYLNVAEWGDGIFGAEAASLHYYGKPASALNPREAAHLAIVLPSPRRYNPLSGTRFIENRAKAVLETMIKRGIVPQEEEE
ncbi:MAG: monofunctional biosynthetic peptidoglycan transglycosylase, partial [Candidatus Aminicenantales bacterium]